MSRNRIKSANSLQTHKVWKLIAVIFVLTLFGLVYVFLQLKIDRLAKENKQLELVRDECKKRNDNLSLQIERMKSPKVLEGRLAYFNIGMVNLNQLQVLDAQDFHSPAMTTNTVSLLAKGRTYP